MINVFYRSVLISFIFLTPTYLEAMEDDMDPLLDKPDKLSVSKRRQAKDEKESGKIKNKKGCCLALLTSCLSCWSDGEELEKVRKAKSSPRYPSVIDYNFGYPIGYQLELFPSDDP